MANPRVKWIDGMNFVGVDADGRGTLISGSSDGPGVSPMQMLLLGLGSCSSVDVVIILKKQRQPLEDIEVELRGVRGDEPPRPYQDIDMHFIVTGHGLDTNKVERAIKLSTEKYCGAHGTLSGVANIKTTYEIRDPKAPTEAEETTES